MDSYDTLPLYVSPGDEDYEVKHYQEVETEDEDAEEFLNEDEVHDEDEDINEYENEDRDEEQCEDGYDDEECYNEVEEDVEQHDCKAEINLSSDWAQLSDADILGMTFDTWEEAGAFYLEYSKQVGFGIRKRDAQYSKEGERRMQKWVCSKEGKRSECWFHLTNRKRNPKPETRENCLAHFRVNRQCATGKWIVKSFVGFHSHSLVKSKHVHFLSCHRRISEGEKVQAVAMQRVGV
jgi:hypothetical protein